MWYVYSEMIFFSSALLLLLFSFNLKMIFLALTTFEKPYTQVSHGAVYYLVFLFFCVGVGWGRYDVWSWLWTWHPQVSWPLKESCIKAWWSRIPNCFGHCDNDKGTLTWILLFLNLKKPVIWYGIHENCLDFLENIEFVSFIPLSSYVSTIQVLMLFPQEKDKIHDFHKN